MGSVTARDRGSRSAGRRTRRQRPPGPPDAAAPPVVAGPEPANDVVPSAEGTRSPMIFFALWFGVPIAVMVLLGLVMGRC